MRQSKLKISSYVFASLLCLISLNGCAKAAFSTCPPVVDYSIEQQAKALSEIEQLEVNYIESEVVNMMLDYAQLREQLSFCNGE